VVIVVPDEVDVRPIHLDSQGDATMTAPMMTLAALAQKRPDVDVLHQRVQFMAQRLMDIDVEGRYGAGYDEKAPGARRNSRNGYRQRLWETRAGSVAPCSLKACRPSAIVLRLGCLQCSAEHRVHLGPSGLWTYTTRWDTIIAAGLLYGAWIDGLSLAHCSSACRTLWVV
jgi:hypothetical protein